MKLRQGRILDPPAMPIEPAVHNNASPLRRSRRSSVVNLNNSNVKSSARPAANDSKTSNKHEKTAEMTETVMVEKPVTRNSSRNVERSAPVPTKSTSNPKPTDKSSTKPTRRRRSGARSRSKRRSKRKRKIESDSEDEYYSNMYATPVVHDGINDLLNGFSDSDEELSLGDEASVIYECKVCKMLFREMSGYLKHKQTSCTTFTESSKADLPGGLNPFLSKEILALCSEDGGENKKPGSFDKLSEQYIVENVDVLDEFKKLFFGEDRGNDRALTDQNMDSDDDDEDEDSTDQDETSFDQEKSDSEASEKGNTKHLPLYDIITELVKSDKRSGPVKRQHCLSDEWQALLMDPDTDLKNKEDEAKKQKVNEDEAKKQMVNEDEAKKQKVNEDEAKKQKVNEDEAKKQKVNEDEAKEQKVNEIEQLRDIEQEHVEYGQDFLNELHLHTNDNNNINVKEKIENVVKLKSENEVVDEIKYNLRQKYRPVGSHDVGLFELLK